MTVPTPILSLAPVTLPAPERGDDLQVRISAPATGDQLPIIVFSHGFSQSMNSYAPLVDFWTASGFAVFQPTHLDSRTLNVTPADPRYPNIWRTRVEDLTRILDNLEVLEAAVPGLAGRLDHTRIAVAGHSWGAQTASTLLGAGVVGEADMTDPRIKAGVLFAIPGTGGADLSPFAAENFPFMSPTFEGLTAPALIVAGDKDDSPLSVRGPEWFTDAYHLSPAPKTLLTLFGAEHSLGGLSGYLVTETTDEDPARVALVRELSVNYLRSVLYPADAPLAVDNSPLGTVESKR
ncbi:hypothetical protein GCM10010435_77790 [Winogradskya consettensis]|uniref:AB hydrolase-1 domain-containing protein n=1 Tax=Winogradskya consettensis TaxID=113560 RepID=A0A919SNR8_9ACTN|nr:alpha/beta fold hydrolase [Actinoplanes consettensis]GIM74777.1 hypothetical protein Aco04nite_42000 [Actinoplanes consettensis]